MPKAMHRALEKEARDKGLTGKRRDAYVYGTMAKAEKRKELARAMSGKK